LPNSELLKTGTLPNINHRKITRTNQIQNNGKQGEPGNQQQKPVLFIKSVGPHPTSPRPSSGHFDQAPCGASPIREGIICQYKRHGTNGTGKRFNPITCGHT